jgi:hypothetical protein
MALTKEQIRVESLKADKANNLPIGTTFGVIAKESGFQDRFMQDPSAAHYTGAKPASSAAGLGGITKGTARDPGHGVTPLSNWGMPEQVRFIGDYVGGLLRSSKGNLENALDRYGTGVGTGYGKSILSKLGPQIETVIPKPVTDNLDVMRKPSFMASLGQVMGGSSTPQPTGLTAPFQPAATGGAKQSYSQFLTSELSRLGKLINPEPVPVPVVAAPDQQPVVVADNVPTQQAQPFMQDLRFLLDSLQNKQQVGTPT